MQTRTFSFVAAVIAAAISAPTASAQTTPPEPSVAVAGEDLPKPPPPMVIRGFRSAHFGMNEAQVRAAIQKDLGSSSKITTAANVAEGTTALVASVPKLDPGPGAARVTYIFGTSSKGLIHVNVAWASSEKPTDAMRQAMIQGGLQLIAYFNGQATRPKAAAGGAAAGSNAIVMYGAVDDAGASVEVRVEGIAFERTVDGKTVPSPPPSGPASLIVSYGRSVLNPDIKTIAPGMF
jgi:hypothetical protein